MGTDQEILLDHPYLDTKYLTGSLNMVRFETDEGFLEKENSLFDRLSLVFSITDEIAVINLANVILKKEGFDLKEAKITDPFFKIKTLGYIRVTDIELKGSKGIKMKGELTVEGKTAQIFEKYSIYDITLQPFLVTEKGIDGFTIKFPEKKIKCLDGSIVVDEIRWEEQAYNQSFELIFDNATYVSENYIIPLKDNLTIDEEGCLWIKLMDKKVEFNDWVKNRPL